MLLLEQVVSGLAIGSVYSLLGLGLTMIFACTKRINFAHADLMALGGVLGLVFLKAMPSFPIATFLRCQDCTSKLTYLFCVSYSNDYSAKFPDFHKSE